jgi:small subunit ribosomal protein S7
MSRRRQAVKREILPDPKYKSVLIAQFMNCLLIQGKKSVAETICYSCIDMMAEKSKQDGVTLFKKAINNVKPILEVKSRRVGGATYQVPVEVSPARRTALAIRWIIGYARERKEKSMAEKLAAEMLQASNNEGAAMKKRADTHKMAEANKAFAHFRW